MAWPLLFVSSMKIHRCLWAVLAASALVACAAHDDDVDPADHVQTEVSACASLPAAVYHRINPTTGASLYTLSATEAANAATKYGFTDDRGIAFYGAAATATGLLPVYRLYNTATADFFWTIDETERTSAKSKYGYVDQGIEFYASRVAQTCLEPVYRFVDAALKKHRFATTQAERDALVAAGWTAEGIQLYAAPAASGGTTPPPPPPPTTTYGAGTQPVGTTCVNPTVTVTPSMTTAAIQSAISKAGANAYVCFASGTYRMTDKLTPLAGQTLHGSPNTILKGSAVLSGATASGTTFVFANVPLATTGPEASAERWCEDTVSYPCAYEEDVFLDGAPLTRVTALSAVKAGTFYTDYAAKKVYVGSNPAGHTVEIGHVPFAVLVGNDNVTIEGLVVEMFAHGMDQGAIAFGTGTGGVVRNCEAFFNHANGAVSWGTNTKFQYNRFHDNGQAGASASGKSGVTMDHNDLVHNNIFGFERNDAAEGGLKIDLEPGAVITYNYVKDNLSFGIYFDENADQADIENNYVDGNWAAGINYVFSRTATIAHNVVTNNGLSYASGRGGCSSATDISCLDAGIQLANSSGTNIHDNTVTGNANGISLVEFTRDPASVSWTVPLLQNNSVHDNVVTIGAHASGVRQFGGPTGYDATKSNNVFAHNTYHLVSLSGSYFWWNAALKTPSQWQAVGQDTTGTFLSP